MNEQKICTHFTNCIFCHSSIYGFRLRIFKVFLHNDCQNNMRDTGTDPGFEVRGSALKKIAPTGVRRENIWGISCEKSRFYAKNHYFPILGPPPWIHPWDRYLYRQMDDYMPPFWLNYLEILQKQPIYIIFENCIDFLLLPVYVV
jgi:hypothetical protein